MSQLGQSIWFFGSTMDTGFFFFSLELWILLAMSYQGCESQVLWVPWGNESPGVWNSMPGIILHGCESPGIEVTSSVSPLGVQPSNSWMCQGCESPTGRWILIHVGLKTPKVNPHRCYPPVDDSPGVWMTNSLNCYGCESSEAIESLTLFPGCIFFSFSSINLLRSISRHFLQRGLK